MPALRLSDGRVVHIEVVGLDMDGVQRDTAYRSWMSVCKTVVEFGGMPPEFTTWVHHFEHDFMPFYRSCGVRAQADAIAKVYGRYQARFERGAPPFSDVAGFLSCLAASGLRSFVVSNANFDYLSKWLVKYGLHAKFGHIGSAPGEKQPSLKEACKTLGVPVASACYVGDLGSDMRNARDAGLIPIGITRGNMTREALLASGAVFVVETLDELAAHIAP